MSGKSQGKAYLITGSTGSGKTTYSAKISLEISALHFAIDEWMKTLFWMDAPHDQDIHWAMERVHRIEAMMEIIIAKELSLGHSVILNLGFSKKEQRARWKGWLQSIDATFQFVYLKIPKEKRWERVQARNLSSGAQTHSIDQKTFEFMEQFFDELSADELMDANILTE